MDNPDFLIIGGGTAGSVLASRLSEDGVTRVLLVEAGPDTPPDATPADIADTFPSSSLNRGYFWPELKAERVAGENRRPYPQARVMGGGSSVMGMWALRGLPADFDAWAKAGAAGWGWDDVVKVYRRLEIDSIRQRTDNSPGAMPIRRVAKEDWPAFARAVEQAALKRGNRPVEDINEDGGDGFFSMPLSQGEGRRASSPQCYLSNAVRRRANLAIWPETRVIALKVSGGRVSGVEVERGGEAKTIAARQVILSAGAIHSPAVLLRSGIGPARDLKALGLTPVVDRPGVGANLQNHPYLHFGLTIPPGLRLDAHLHQFGLAALRLSSGLPDCPAGDLLVFAIGRVSPRPDGAALGMLGAALYSPFSRGKVTLESPDAHAPPRIDFRFMSDPRDGPRMLQAARYAESLLHDPAVSATYEDAFLLPPVLSLHQFNRPGLMGSLFAAAGKVVLAGPRALKRAALERVISPGRWVASRERQAPVRDEEILAAAAPMGHPIGTCAIGPPDAPLAVVDPECRFYGLDNLRVVDASVMPNIPSANTNLPTTMVAERAADLIRAGR